MSRIRGDIFQIGMRVTISFLRISYLVLVLLSLKLLPCDSDTLTFLELEVSPLFWHFKDKIVQGVRPHGTQLSKGLSHL